MLLPEETYQKWFDEIVERTAKCVVVSNLVEWNKRIYICMH